VSDQLEHSRRTQYSLFLSTDHSVDFSRDIIHQINVYPSVRYDRFSGMPGSLSPRVGVNVGIWRPFGVRIKSSVGRSFHAPSFIDLYWKNSGNPSLQPERAVAFDVGVAASVLMGGRLDVEASYFNTRTKDRIAWVPQKDGLWKPKNLLEVESIGLELVAGYHLFNDDLIIRASYTNSDVRKSASAIAGDQTLNKQLPYLPHEMADVSLMFRLSPINVSIHHAFTGFRYITETNDAGFILSPFQKTDVSMSAGILNEPFKARLSMEVSNLLNTEYEIFPNYPMPLRTFGVRLSVDY
jgi:vitamin B12 transporter